jgi:hypothetical protein
MTRSPNYPRVSLPEAVELVKRVWSAEGKNKLNPEAVSQVLGFSGYHGSAQVVVSALRKYKLLEGRGDELRVSPQAINIIEAPKGSPQRAKALREAALGPKLFAELAEEYETVPSESTLRLALLNREFTRDAAEIAASSYRTTREFVATESEGYTPEQDETDEDTEVATRYAEQGASGDRNDAPRSRRGEEDRAPSTPSHRGVTRVQKREGYRQDVFALDEGEAIIQWPEGLSSASYQDFKDWLELVLRKVKRSVPESDLGAGEGKTDGSRVEEV